MGLQDDMNRLNSSGDAAKTAELQRREALYRIASNVWTDFLSYCKEFAELAPRNGHPPHTGQKVRSKHRVKDRGNWDHVIDNPGGWTFNVEGHMFCITTDGTLLTEKKVKKSTGLFPPRTRYIHRFEPCPAFPASPSELREGPGAGEAHLPGVFRLVNRGTYSAPSDVVQRDLARFGGALAVSTYAIEGDGMKRVFAKDLVLSSMRTPPAR